MTGLTDVVLLMLLVVGFIYGIVLTVQEIIDSWSHARKRRFAGGEIGDFSPPPEWPLYVEYDGRECRCTSSVSGGQVWRFTSHKCSKHRGLPASYRTIGAK